MRTQIIDLEKFIEFLKGNKALFSRKYFSNEHFPADASKNDEKTEKLVATSRVETANSSLKKFLVLSQLYTVLLLSCGTKSMEPRFNSPTEKKNIDKKSFRFVEKKFFNKIFFSFFSQRFSAKTRTFDRENCENHRKFKRNRWQSKFERRKRKFFFGSSRSRRSTRFRWFASNFTWTRTFSGRKIILRPLSRFIDSLNRQNSKFSLFHFDLLLVEPEKFLLSKISPFETNFNFWFHGLWTKQIRIMEIFSRGNEKVRTAFKRQVKRFDVVDQRFVWLFHGDWHIDSSHQPRVDKRSTTEEPNGNQLAKCFQKVWNWFVLKFLE